MIRRNGTGESFQIEEEMERGCGMFDSPSQNIIMGLEKRNV